MATSKLTQGERRRKHKLKLEKRYKDREDRKISLRKFLNVGGSHSDIDLVVMAAAKLDYFVSMDISVGQHIVNLNKILVKREYLKHKPLDPNFYSSKSWKLLRYQAFERYGNRCQCCGAKPSDGITLHVDHIKPRSLYRELELDINNLQILCEDCNIGKLNQWDTSWIGSY